MRQAVHPRTTFSPGPDRRPPVGFSLIYKIRNNMTNNYMLNNMLNNMINNTTKTTGAALTFEEISGKHIDISVSKETFMQAVKRKKITELTDKVNNPDKKRRYCPDSVDCYVANGGFKLRTKPACGAILVAESKPDPVPKECETRSAGNSQVSSPAGQPATQQPAPTSSVRPRGQATRRPAPKKAKPDGKRKSAQLSERQAKKDETTRDEAAAKTRRHLPLRKLKDLLRHLNFEETKSIRDWADNRLLTVRRPVSPQPVTP
jgi:hypothetical protein